jgi:hypothetical protein
VPALSIDDRNELVETLNPLACEAADDLWLKHMIEPGGGEDQGSVYLLPARWCPRVTDTLAYLLLAGLLGRL